MAIVSLAGDLSLFTEGEKEFQTTASNVKQIFEELGGLYPRLKPHLEQGVAVAIDGKIYQNAWLEAVSSDSEVHIFHGIGGG